VLDGAGGPAAAACGGERPFRPHVYWYPSFRCNLACEHCAVASSPWVDTSQDLDAEQCLRVVDQMAQLGVGRVMLSGGEVLLRPDVRDILRALADRDIAVGLESNGLCFDRTFAELARTLQARGLLGITVSLDGGTAETHEMLRGPRSFHRTLRGLRLLKENRVRFDIQAVLNRANIETIPDLYELAEELRPQLGMLQFAFLNPVGRGTALVKELGLRGEDFPRLFEEILRCKPRFSGKTLIKGPPALVPPRYLGMVFQDPVVRKSVSCQFPLLGVLPNGDVTVCAVSRDNQELNFGNVRETTLSEIWSRAGMAELRCRYMVAEDLTGICGDCLWKHSCRGGCRAWAYEEGRSFDAPLPICRVLAEEGHFPEAYRLSRRSDAFQRQFRRNGGLPASEDPGAKPSGPSDYRSFVQPEHPLIQDLFPPPPAQKAVVLSGALDFLRRNISYRSYPGRRSFDELRQLWPEWDGGQPRLNCINLSCLLASYLRHAGFGGDEAFVALGGLRRHPHVHAWTLVRQGPGLLWIDPANLEPVATTGTELMKTYILHVIFNDRSLCFTEGEKRRVLLGTGA
jgi:radical SAM protein with 4Fe4S-binding SPASM domain